MSAGDWKEMYAAASEGDLELVKYHIQNGVDPNYQHPEILATPLVTAISQGHFKVVEYLLSHGADPALVSIFDNMDAFQAAERHRRFEVLALLQAKFPRPEQNLLTKLKRQIASWFSSGLP